MVDALQELMAAESAAFQTDEMVKRKYNKLFNAKGWKHEEYIMEYLCAGLEGTFAVVGGIGSATGADAKHAGKFKKLPGAFLKTDKIGTKKLAPKEAKDDEPAKPHSMMPNPYFFLHGIESDEYGATRRYLRARAVKTFGSAGVSVAGSIGSAATLGVNTGSAAKAASSLAQTAMHIHQLKAVARKWPQSGPVQRWVGVLLDVKHAKLLAKGIDLGGSLNSVAGMVGNFATIGIKLGIKVNMDHIAKRVACELHWRAYQETVIGGAIAGKFQRRTGMTSAHAKGAQGPASEILYELFKQRGGSWATKLICKYDVDRFIRESVGWEAVTDKLKLI